ncbi:MAG: GTPase HflX [Rhodospirillaceae bacterium]|nr:GTPase HflX [Rhodospirillaceae bacterium]
MIERPDSGERSLLLHVGLKRSCYADEIQEFQALSVSAGAEIAGEISARRTRPDPGLYIGQGKVKELAKKVKDVCADLVLVNQPLSATQERNLEKNLGVRVLDRNGLILDIFAQRAATHEGKLQVELAQLEHLSTRLVRGWTHLERQKGGIGLRGPGETQLESDRRLVGLRIKRLKARLESVVKQRELGRRERRRVRIPTVALVGYTNAGKTSLFNALSGAEVRARNTLFATLDPTIRRLSPGELDEVLLVDTVGFVRDLPHELIAAFRATLTETREANLLVHVIDVSDPHSDDRKRQVEMVLDSIGAGNIPRLQVYNKADRAKEFSSKLANIAEVNGTELPNLLVSALTGDGVENLAKVIRVKAVGESVFGRLELGPGDSRLRAKLFELKAVQSELSHDSGGWTLELALTPQRWKEFCIQEGLSDDSFQRV